MKKLLKTVFIMTLIVSLAVSIAPISCTAQENEQTSYWLDSFVRDSSYIVSGDNEFASMSDSIYSNVYHVKTADQLISALTADYDYPKIVLDNDIDMLGSKGCIWDWGVSFTGILDGQNHTISDLKMTGGSYFIRNLNSSSILENVNFEFSKSDNLGCLIGNNYGQLTNVHVTIAKDSTYTQNNSAVLVADNTKYGTISDCSVNGDFCVEARRFASIAWENYGRISDCVFNGSIKSEEYGNDTFAMIEECFAGSHTARLICNFDTQGSELRDILSSKTDQADIDYETIYYSSGLSLQNNDSQCKKIDSIADVAKDEAFDFDNKYKVISEPSQITFDKKYLESFNNQVSTTDHLTLQINGDNYNAEVYKNLKLVVFEIPLIIDASDISASYSITGTLDQNEIELKKDYTEVDNWSGLWSAITVKEGDSQTEYKIFYKAKAGATYFIDLDFANMNNYLAIDSALLDQDKKMRLAFSFAGDPGEITASNMVAKWFSDDLKLKNNDRLLVLTLDDYAYGLDMSYNGQTYPVVVILSTPNNKMADWSAQLGGAPQWAIDQVMEKYPAGEDFNDEKLDSLIKEEFSEVAPTSYLNFYSNHDATEIKNNISSGNLLAGVFSGILSGRFDLSYNLQAVCDSVNLVDGKCVVSYQTGMELVCNSGRNIEDKWDMNLINEIKSVAQLEAATTVATDEVLLQYSVKVRSYTKGRTADESYEYVIESGSLEDDGNETRNEECRKTLSSSDTNGLLGTIEVSYADLLDKKTKEFKDHNTVRYYVRQLPGDDKDILYDASEYTIEIPVSAEDRGLQTVSSNDKDIRVYKDGVPTSLTLEELCFENVYKDPVVEQLRTATETIKSKEVLTAEDYETVRELIKTLDSLSEEQKSLLDKSDLSGLKAIAKALSLAKEYADQKAELEKTIAQLKESAAQPKESATKEAPISLKQVSSLKLAAKKAALQITWGKVEGAVSYQIQISEKKSFKAAKTYKKAVKDGDKAKKISYKCGKLKKKKKYYVRVRAVDSKGQTGPWSKAVSKKTK